RWLLFKSLLTFC
ncbi:hypothetical protein D030_3719B, partial [Vibrio parahaemolyticus AQ3810]